MSYFSWLCFKCQTLLLLFLVLFNLTVWNRFLLVIDDGVGTIRHILLKSFLFVVIFFWVILFQPSVESFKLGKLKKLWTLQSDCRKNTTTTSTRKRQQKRELLSFQSLKTNGFFLFGNLITLVWFSIPSVQHSLEYVMILKITLIKSYTIETNNRFLYLLSSTTYLAKKEILAAVACLCLSLYSTVSSCYQSFS